MLNSLARAVVKAPKSSHITPILRSLHWLKVNERIEYKLLLPTKFLQPVNLATLKIWSLFNPLAIPALLCHPFSSTNHLLIENHRLLIQVCITPSLQSTPWFIPSASPVMSRLTPSFSLSAHLYYHHHSHHPSLLHSFTPGSKPTFSTNPSHLRFLLVTGLPSWRRDWTGPIMLIVLFLVSHFVCSVWWTKLARAID